MSDEFSDMQNLVRFGNGHLREACFLLLRVSDAAAARAWLQAAPINDARKADELPDSVLQVAFSAGGLQALGVDQAVIEGFSDEFIVGMSGDVNRSRRLGDSGDSRPEAWDWGHAEVADLLLMVYAREGELQARLDALEDAQFKAAFAEMRRLQTALLERNEPFGFADGISQPQIDWENRLSTDLHARNDYTNRLKTGEVLLGYVNEYGLYTDRPLLSTESHPRAAILPPAEDEPGYRDLGRNGCYLVFRQLEQDVPGFWQFIDQATEGDAGEREKLAAAMVGRERDGTPLIRSGSGENDFSFDADPQGYRCPVGAHVRRANPRTGDFPPGSDGLLKRLLRTLGFYRRHATEDLVSSTRFHRLLRRGRAYGPVLPPEDALKKRKDSKERGLHFICLGANILRQFEFVQNAWLMNSHFAGLEGESDPLLGSREALAGGGATDGFSRPRADAPARRVAGLPRFVRVRGGGYFFMPGIRALRYIAGSDDSGS